MQVEIKTNSSGFQPIEINFKIETPEELCDFYERMYVDRGDLNGHHDIETIHGMTEEEHTCECELSDILVELGLKLKQ